MMSFLMDAGSYRSVRAFVEINMDAHGSDFTVLLGADFMLDHCRHTFRLAAQRFFPRVVVDGGTTCLERDQARLAWRSRWKFPLFRQNRHPVE